MACARCDGILACNSLWTCFIWAALSSLFGEEQPLTCCWEKESERQRASAFIALERHDPRDYGCVPLGSDHPCALLPSKLSFGGFKGVAFKITVTRNSLIKKHISSSVWNDPTAQLSLVSPSKCPSKAALMSLARWKCHVETVMRAGKMKRFIK